MATVYLAIQESFGREVAVKVMSAELAKDPEFGERFQREAMIVSRMNHPHIVTVHDVGVVGLHHYLAMQYVEGSELRSCFYEMSLANKLRVTKEVASALNYAGNKGYVHRDVKPDNVMISKEDGRAILMDFGIAKASDGDNKMTKTGMAVGTPYYMSPEQAQGKPVDKRTDIYSLGIMFFQMLTGYVPYEAESGVSIAVKHITDPVPRLPGHLQLFQPIIDKVMAKNPDDRYQTGAEFIQDLDKIDAAALSRVARERQPLPKIDSTAPTILPGAIKPPPVKSISAAPAAVDTETGKKGFMLGAVLVVVLVVSAAGYFYLSQPKPEPESVVMAETSVSVTQTQSQDTAPSAEVVTQSVAPSVVQAAVQSTSQQSAPSPQADKEAAAAAEKARQEQEARDDAEQKIAKEKLRQEGEARAAAQTKAEADAKAAAEAANKAANEKVAQAKRDEVARRLDHAKVLQKSGAVVVPVDDNAVLAYRKVLEVDPDNAVAKQALKTIESNYITIIQDMMKQNDLDGLDDIFKNGAIIFPNSAPINKMRTFYQQEVNGQ